MYLSLEQLLIIAWIETSQYLVAAEPRHPRLAAESPAVSTGARCKRQPCKMQEIALFCPPRFPCPISSQSPTAPAPHTDTTSCPEGPVPFPLLAVPSASLSLPGFAGLTPDTASVGHNTVVGMGRDPHAGRAPCGAAAPPGPAAPGAGVAPGQRGVSRAAGSGKRGEQAQFPPKHQGCCGGTLKYIPPPGISVTLPGLIPPSLGSSSSCLSPSPSPPSPLLNDCKASHFLSPITPAQYPRPCSKHSGTVRCLPSCPAAGHGQRRKVTARGRDQYGAFISRPHRASGSTHLQALLLERTIQQEQDEPCPVLPTCQRRNGHGGLLPGFGSFNCFTGAVPSLHSQGRGVG